MSELTEDVILAALEPWVEMVRRFHSNEWVEMVVPAYETALAMRSIEATPELRASLATFVLDEFMAAMDGDELNEAGVREAQSYYDPGLEERAVAVRLVLPDWLRPVPEKEPEEPPVIQVRYRNHHREVRMRNVRPTGVRFGVTEWHPNPQWLLEVRDEEKGAARTFALADCDFTSGRKLRART